MRQFDPDALRAFTRQVTAGGVESQELVASDGSRLVYERAPSPGVTGEVTELGPDGSVRSRQCQYVGSPTPPPRYPPSIPFVPGHPVGVTEPDAAAEHVVVIWEAVADPGDLVATIREASLRDGWTRVDGPAGPIGRRVASLALGAIGIVTGATYAVEGLERTGRQRLVNATGRRGEPGQVTLAEFPRGAAVARAPTDEGPRADV